MSEKTVIQLDNVFVRTAKGHDVFSDLNFHLDAGETKIITGGPGSGKTLLVELLIGQSFADAGSIELFGELLTPRRKGAINRVRRKIGGVGGIFDLIPGMTVAQNIAYPMVLSGASTRLRKERLLAVLTEFSLLNQAGDSPNTLTRVEKTLLLLARASVANQPLIIIDEPTAGLDKATADRVFDYLVKMSVSGRSMIIVGSDIPWGNIPNSEHLELGGGQLK